MWNVLGIEPTSDLKKIKQAYSRLVRLHHPEDDAEAYQKIQEAYYLAREEAKKIAQREQERKETEVSNIWASSFEKEIESRDDFKKSETETASFTKEEMVVSWEEWAQEKQQKEYLQEAFQELLAEEEEPISLKEEVKNSELYESFFSEEFELEEWIRENLDKSNFWEQLQQRSPQDRERVYWYLLRIQDGMSKSTKDGWILDFHAHASEFSSALVIEMSKLVEKRTLSMKEEKEDDGICIAGTLRRGFSLILYGVFLGVWLLRLFRMESGAGKDLNRWVLIFGFLVIRLYQTRRGVLIRKSTDTPCLEVNAYRRLNNWGIFLLDILVAVFEVLSFGKRDLLKILVIGIDLLTWYNIPKEMKRASAFLDRMSQTRKKISILLLGIGVANILYCVRFLMDDEMLLMGVFLLVLVTVFFVKALLNREHRNVWKALYLLLILFTGYYFVTVQLMRSWTLLEQTEPYIKDVKAILLLCFVGYVFISFCSFVIRGFVFLIRRGKGNKEK